MKKYAFVILIMSFLVAPAVQSADSFRLEGGQLLQNGMTKGEVLDKAGKPKMKDTIRRAGSVVKVEAKAKTTQ